MLSPTTRLISFGIFNKVQLVFFMKMQGEIKLCFYTLANNEKQSDLVNGGAF